MVDHGGFHDVFAEPDHNAPTDSSKGCIAEVLNLKQDADIRGETKLLAVGQRQELLSSNTLGNILRMVLRSEARTHLFKFSTHSGSTLPSKIIQCLFPLSPRASSTIFRRTCVKSPSSIRVLFDRACCTKHPYAWPRGQ